MASRLERYMAMFSQKASSTGADTETKLIPPPIGGWDAISPLSAMDPKYARILTNWVPRPGWLELRGGYNAWAQGLSGGDPVESLMAYRPAGATDQLFAAAGGSIYNCSTNGVYTTVISGASNARWQHVNFTPANGSNYLLLVNGEDPYIGWDGTTWAALPISGVSSSTFINITAFKRRLWFIPANSTTPYYLDTDAIQGTAHPFPLGSFMSKGGCVMAMGTWTIDGGVGPDDYAVFITSKGQAIVYKGTDPANANAFALVGVFDIPPPIGRRCLVKINSDLGIITTQGLIPASQALPFDPSSVRSIALTNQIQNAMVLAAQNGLDQFGWEVELYMLQTLMIMNVPQTENSSQVQYVMNMLTGAWCEFQGWNANCFEIFNNNLFFGDNDGNVNLAYTSSLDLTSPIVAEMACAFNYFDEPGRIKNLKMLRPLIIADGQVTPTLGVDVDFGTTALTSPVSIITPSGAVWDTSKWDNSTWSTGTVTVNQWLSVLALGTALSIKMQVNVAGSNVVIAQNSVFDTGVFDTMVFDGNGATASGQNLLKLQVNSFEGLMEYGSPI